MSDDIEADPRLVELARDYLAQLESGQRPDRQAYLNRYPELAEEAAECLDGLELAQAFGLAMKPRQTPAIESQTPGEPLGDFRIVRELGRGGMGVVYEAVQLSLNRRVALKVLPFASGLDPKHLHRFRTEAHAAAQLQHANIVPVFAVGQDRGTHYYAMQLIEGKPLDAVITELRGGKDGTEAAGATTHLVSDPVAGGRSSPAVTKTYAPGTAERHRRAVRFALQVAGGLEYAHEAGVVHRDIKPANLLLDGKGHVWITDFGLAQIRSDSNVTRTGDIFGTLRYMSPEQATGQRWQIDQRSDIYSLGATLYELLTLQPLFPHTERVALLHAILNDDPIPPKKHDRTIPAELETIAMKALAKMPGERYATAAAFTADLQCFLDDRPIAARRPTSIDRARKWLRRHPAYARAGIAIAVLSSVGFGLSTAMISNAQQKTSDALVQERKRSEEAEERFRLAQRAVDDIISVANDELANDPVQESLRRKLLESALTYYREFIELRSDDPKALEDLEATKVRVQSLLADLAVMQGSLRHQLLRIDQVQSELKLTSTQREALKELFRESHDLPSIPYDEFTKLPADERSKRFVDHHRALDAAIAPILLPVQSKRLAQLALQARGPMAFRDGEVVDALKITADQKDQMRNIAFGRPPRNGPPEQHRGGGGGPPRGGGGGGGPGPQRGDAQEAERFLAVLTSEQRALWQSMTGEPFFQGRSGIRIPGFGGPGGPGGPR